MNTFKENFIAVDFFGSLILPCTFFLGEDEFVSRFGVSLILPPEFVSILPVFWTETKHSVNIKRKAFFFSMKDM